jgi:hypothetical protein
LRRPPEILLPPRQRWSRVALAISAALHGLLFFVWIEGRQPVLPHRPSELIVLAAPAAGPTVVPMPYYVPRAAGTEGTGTSAQRAIRPALRDEPQAVAALPEPPPEQVVPDTGTPAPPPRSRTPIGITGPGLAEGRLWVRPLPLPPKDLAKRLSKGHVELVDSAVTAIVQAYLDSIAAEPASRNAALPSWTTNIAGKKFGVDGKNIYVAGLKIPAAVLALLPISMAGANVDQNRAYNHMMDLRTDLQYAAQRSANLAEFKEMIRDMRLRKEREREFEANQRTAPPPDSVRAPTP